MNRRDFLKGLTVSTVAGLLIPERRFWSLDRTMVNPPLLYALGIPRGLADVPIVQFPPGDFLVSNAVTLRSDVRYGLGFVDTSGYLSVVDFGADSTGMRDSTAAIQAAIDYAAGMRG